MADGVGSGADLHIPKNIGELAVLNGMPAQHANRTVIISQRPLKSVQSGQAHAHQWQITWPNQERWKNPLMGWVSSADPMSQVFVSTTQLFPPCLRCLRRPIIFLRISLRCCLLAALRQPGGSHRVRRPEQLEVRADEGR
jgi:hypothetical protein